MSISPVTANAATQTKSLEELFEEMKTADRKKLEELRPLCEELPVDALDPVTLEPFEEPRLAKCGHTLDTKTMENIYNANRRVREDGDPVIACPICKDDSSVFTLYYDHAFDETIDHLKKIRGIFNKKVSDDSSKTKKKNKPFTGQYVRMIPLFLICTALMLLVRRAIT